MRIDVIQSSSTINNEFDILYDGKLRYKSRLPFVTIKEPLGLEKIREIKVYDLNGHEVYSTDYKYVENKVEEFIPFKFLVTGSQKFNQLLFTSKTNNIKVYFEEKEIWKNRYVIEMDGKKYFCYSVEDGYIRHFPVYDGEKQVGEILKSNVVIDAKDEYCCYLKDEYKNIADGIVALLLYLDRSQYSSSYLVNKSLVLEKRYSYNKNNKYYDGDWVKNNFGNEYYEKVDNDINKVKSIIKSPKRLWDYQWKSLNKKDKILMVIAVFGVWIIMAIVLIALLIGFAVNKIKSNDNNTNSSINDNTTDRQIVSNISNVANSNIEFINYINDIDSKITQTKKYEIKHGNLKFIAVPVDDDIVGTYKYELYYNNNLLDTNRLKDNARYGTTKAYLFSGDNSAYVLVSEIVPVAAHSRYSIIVIDNNGKVLLSQIVISPKIDVNNNEINYSFETRMQEEQGLGVTAEHSDDFCQYLRDNYNDDNYVVKGNYSYKYDNNELILIKNEEKTIKTYKENYNCN